MDAENLRFGPDGLLPVIVQDSNDGRVLMLAYTNAQALALTLDTGELHFWSRARRALWRKGETSGNTLHLVGMSVDCDQDALLVMVAPNGPTCHTGARSCFDSSAAALAAASDVDTLQGFGWLETLWGTIVSRAAIRPEGSYTTRLLAAGVDGPARKVAEEALEVLMAAKDDAYAQAAGVDRTVLRDAMTGEVADLFYHALVLLAERGLPPATVIEKLKARHTK